MVILIKIQIRAVFMRKKLFVYADKNPKKREKY